MVVLAGEIADDDCGYWGYSRVFTVEERDAVLEVLKGIFVVLGCGLCGIYEGDSLQISLCNCKLEFMLYNEIKGFYPKGFFSGNLFVP